MRIQLSDHFTYSKLLRFVYPSIMMMIFTSIYSVVDGLFVSNYVGKTPFAALNLIWPVIMLLAAVGFMLGTGGSAIVAKTLGEGDRDKANAYFSLLIYVTLGVSIVLAAAGLVWMPEIAVFLGATEEMLPHCVIYGRLTVAALPAFMLQNAFQSFFPTAEKPKLGLVVTAAAGLTNMVLDYVFVAVFRWGLAGAALATGMCQVVGGVVPLFYFFSRNSSLLRLGKTRFSGRVLLKTCTNGSSELMTNVCNSVVNILYNFQLMRLIGEDGVSAFGIIMYVMFIFAAAFLGYSMGVAPVVGYHYGADNRAELHSLLTKSLRLITGAGVLLVALAEVLAMPLARLFVGYDPELAELTCHAFRLFSLSYLFMGLNIFGSAFFTALSNGAVSAGISFLRTLVFQVIAVLVLPVFFDVEGVWMSVIVAEVLALGVTAACLAKNRKKYGY